MMYWNEILQQLIYAEEVLIYGAGMMGKTVKKCLEELPCPIKIRSFLVGSMQGNPDQIEGVPVIELAQASGFRDVLVLAALHEKHMAGALKQLSEAGFCRVLPLSFDSDEWSDIRGNWFEYEWKRQQKQYVDLNGMLSKDLHVYVAQSVADRPLRETVPWRSFEIPIQVGAALTEKQIAAVTDAQGENISKKNKRYCELTALYWMWKHDSAKYLGLSHYRRRFDIREQMVPQFLGSEIDVVVTVPVLNIRGVREQYCCDHVENDWNIMLETIEEMFPQYGDAADRVQKGNYYYAYNMLIARREIVNEYCGWLFPVLFCCEKKIGEREDSYQGRYIGFLAERLMTIFLERHKKEYKLAIAKKHFIETIE